MFPTTTSSNMRLYQHGSSSWTMVTMFLILLSPLSSATSSSSVTRSSNTTTCNLFLRNFVTKVSVPKSVREEEASDLFHNAFGAYGQVAELLRNYDFGTITEGDDSTYLHIHLAPSFGKLRPDLATMDQYLLVTIGTTTSIIKDLDVPLAAWNDLTSAMLNNPLLVPTGNCRTDARDYHVKTTSWFKYSGSVSQAIVNEVQDFLTSFVGDQDILDSIRLEVQTLEQIVGKSGAKLRHAWSFLYQKTHIEKSIIEVGVIRYPIPTSPHFILYKLEMQAWADLEHVLIHDTDKNGFRAKINVCTYGIATDILDMLEADLKRRVAELSKKNLEHFLLHES